METHMTNQLKTEITFTADDMAERLEARDRTCEAAIETAVTEWQASYHEHIVVLENLDEKLAHFEALIERIRDARVYPAIDMETAVDALISAVEDLPLPANRYDQPLASAYRCITPAC